MPGRKGSGGGRSRSGSRSVTRTPGTTPAAGPKQQIRFTSRASASAAARIAAAAPDSAATSGGLQGAGDYKLSPIAAYFRMYGSRIAPAVGSNLARGMAGDAVIGAIKAATPGLTTPAPWKQGIRAYYPSAKGLRGLNVRDNWMFRIEAFDDNSNPGNVFLVGALYNPHPGGQMLFLGQQKVGWQIAPAYENPETGQVPKRLRFMGKSSTTYSDFVKRKKPVAENESLHNKIVDIISKRNNEDAKLALLDAQTQTVKRLNFGPKNQMYLQWAYTNKQLAAMRATASSDPKGGFSG